MLDKLPTNSEIVTAINCHNLFIDRFTVTGVEMMNCYKMKKEWIEKNHDTKIVLGFCSLKKVFRVPVEYINI